MVVVEPKQRVAAHTMSIEQRLAAHLQAWIGLWPPSTDLEIVAWSGRDVPEWDGGTWLGLGVESPLGTVFSVSPRLMRDPEDMARERIEAALRTPTSVPTGVTPAGIRLLINRFVFRWSDQAADLPGVGEWVAPDTPNLPGWLRVFNDNVLVAWDDDQVAAAVGIKRHNAYGHEISVVTEPGFEGRGLARQLVAQAARRVLADGAVPLYFHLPGNIASARVADAAGFPDRGWWGLGMH